MFRELLETKDKYNLEKTGKGRFVHYVIIKNDGEELINMEFSSPEEAEKYASKKGWKLDSKGVK